MISTIVLLLILACVKSFRIGRVIVNRSKRYGGQTPSLDFGSTLVQYTNDNLNKLNQVASQFTNQGDIKWNFGPTVILLDWSVRDFDTLNNLDIPQWARLNAKMTWSKQEVKNDKFLYSHDIGEDIIHNIAIARIPLQMYQKLDLARKIVETVQGGSSTWIHVYMIKSPGDKFIDVDMCEALQAAIQVHTFTLPNFKRGSTFIQTGGSVGFTYIRGSRGELDTIENVKDYASSTKTSDWPPRENLFAAAAREVAEGTLNPAEVESREQCSDTSNSLVSETETRESLILAGLNVTKWINHGTNLARALSIVPPNILHPAAYNSLLKDMAKNLGVKFDEWNPLQLDELGCGAFVAVTRGNGPIESRHDRLIRLQYVPVAATTEFTSALSTLKGLSTPISVDSSMEQENYWSMAAKTRKGPVGSQRPVVLVGKGVCYDTGGVNVKSANSMKTMKADMAGSAAALGTFVALVNTAFPLPVECWLAIVENNIDRNAMRPDDVVRTVTGDTIEIVHSDAEGRLLLADVLALASRKAQKPSITEFASISPALMIDFATLTGTCITSLSNRYIGAFSNRRELVDDIIGSGERCGERVWPFPMDEDYDDDLKSDVADVLQCRQPTEADHIYAARLLHGFVRPTVPWIHLDLGSAHRPGGLAHVGSDYTGAGPRLAVEIIKTLIR